jgi:hypothetical protein
MDMRSATSWREICAGVVFLASIAHAAPGARASPLVVADEACAHYEIDIASFATCEDGRVVMPAAAAAPTLQVVADEACEHYAIDIVSFATCIEGHVARPDEELPAADVHLVEHQK